MTAPTPLRDDTQPQALIAGTTGEAVVVDESQPRPAGLKVSSKRANATLAALMVMAFLLVTNEIAPMGLISVMADDLGVSEARIGWLTTAFTLANMMATLPLTFLTTKWGRRNAIAFASLVWTVGVLVVALSGTFEWLLVGRAITGSAHALWWAVAGPAIAGIFSPKVRGKKMTQLQIGSGFAGVAGLPVLVVAVQYVDWHVPFWLLAAAGLGATVAAFALMPNYRTSEGSAPTGDLPSWANWARVLSVLVLVAGSMGLTWTYIRPFFTEVAGFSESALPWLFLFGGSVGTATSFVMSLVVDRWPVKSVAVSTALLLAAWLVMGTIGSSQIAMILVILLQSLGWAGLVGSLVAWSMRHTPLASDIGIGVHGMGFNGGYAAASFAGAWLFTTIGIGNLPWVSAGMTALAAVLVLTVAPRDVRRLRARRRRVLA